MQKKGIMAYQAKPMATPIDIFLRRECKQSAIRLFFLAKKEIILFLRGLLAQGKCTEGIHLCYPIN